MLSRTHIKQTMANVFTLLIRHEKYKQQLDSRTSQLFAVNRQSVAAPQKSRIYLPILNYEIHVQFIPCSNPIKGSPFIQAFCQTMKDYGDCFSLDRIFKKITSDLQRQNPPQSPEYRSVGVPTDLVFTRTK